MLERVSGKTLLCCWAFARFAGFAQQHRGMKSDFPQHPRRNTPVVARVASTQYERPPRQYGAASRPWTRKQRPPQMARGSQPAARCPVSYPRLTVQPSGYLSGAQEAVGDGAHHQRGAGAGVARHIHGSREARCVRGAQGAMVLRRRGG